MNHRFQSLIRLLVTAGLLVALTHYFAIDWQATFLHIGRIQPFWLTGALVAVVLMHGIAVVTVKKLLEMKGYSIPFRRLLQNHLRGLLVAQFAPSALLGDVIRIHDLQNSNPPNGSSQTANHHPHPHSWKTVTWAFTLQRVVNLCIALTILTATSILIVSHQQQSIAFLGLMVAISLLFFLGLLALVRKCRPQLWQKLSQWIPTIRELRVCTFFGLLQNMTLLLAVTMVSQGMEMNVPFHYLIAAVEASLMVVVLPISLNGLGVRESVYVAYLTPQFATIEQSVALSLTMYSISLLISTCGIVAWAKKHSR